MTQTTNKTQTAILASIDARIAKARSDDNESLARKFEDERKYFVKAEFCDFFDVRKIDVKFFDTIAIYALQKVRKIIQCAISENNVKLDTYTRCFLKNAQVLAKEKIDFTYALHNAALSKSCSAQRSAKLAMRLNSSANTATTQSSSTRQALQALKLATVYKTKDNENATRVDLDNDLVKLLVS